jgi:lysozyme
VRRRLVVLVIALVVLAVVGATGWYLWLPQQRPSLAEGERYGIDVSHHQGDIDWSAVAGDGIAFAYLKATEGGDHVDTRFEASWSESRAAGIDRGAYHFFTLCTPGDEQAEHFLATVPEDADLPPALDLELAGNCSQRPPEDRVRLEVEAWVQAVEQATGERVLVYVGQDWADRYGHRVTWGDDLWIPRFWRRPTETWQVWQLTFAADVHGIDGGVDLNVGRAPVG